MQMWVMGKGRAPGVEDGSEAKTGTEVLGVGTDGEQRIGGGFKEEIIDTCLVVVGDIGYLGR